MISLLPRPRKINAEVAIERHLNLTIDTVTVHGVVVEIRIIIVRHKWITNSRCRLSELEQLKFCIPQPPAANETVITTWVLLCVRPVRSKFHNERPVPRCIIWGDTLRC